LLFFAGRTHSQTCQKDARHNRRYAAHAAPLKLETFNWLSALETVFTIACYPALYNFELRVEPGCPLAAMKFPSSSGVFFTEGIPLRMSHSGDPQGPQPSTSRLVTLVANLKLPDRKLGGGTSIVSLIAAI
jgi:hypothetical protein